MLLNTPTQFSLRHRRPSAPQDAADSPPASSVHAAAAGPPSPIMKQRTACENRFPFVFHTYCTHNRRRATATPLLFFLLLFSDVSSTYKCYKKNPVSIQSTRWRNGSVRLFFICPHALPSPTQKKAQVFETIYRHMYKRDGLFFSFFLFVTTWREKIDQMSTDAFSHSKRTADLRVALDVITNERSLKRKINADLWRCKTTNRWDEDGMLERLHIHEKEALPASITFFFLFFFFLKDAIEGFFDKVANSTKKEQNGFPNEIRHRFPSRDPSKAGSLSSLPLSP